MKRSAMKCALGSAAAATGRGVVAGRRGAARPSGKSWAWGDGMEWKGERVWEWSGQGGKTTETADGTGTEQEWGTPKGHADGRVGG